MSTWGVARLSGDAWHDSVRRLFAETVDVEFQHTICLVSPLSGAPVRLVTAVDPEQQELLMLREKCVKPARLPEVSSRDGEIVLMGIVPAGSALCAAIGVRGRFCASAWTRRGET